ncbi:ABC transporter, ATP-binding protein [Lentilactobacillus parafarraginis F0439]|uniref:ABC transporter, ATP-binding protein n=1 Tax=Lentilactobacillus parafarraginis F0439 TaxID=797515 RepID=G9ZTL7_9LACO|nr:ABC transporter ATP-binding protein [Lentilactobacillus parafarraginis]EHL95130.1 ABC transporter, ATP-binding protein [Lentilactobacillus parafarraginis F0439]
MTPILTTNHLKFHYPDQPPLFTNLDLSIASGEVMTILGPNGIGKSTLLQCVMGLLRPTGGAVDILGKSLLAIPTKQRAQLVAYVPQHSNLHVGLTVLDFVVTGRTPYLAFSQPPKPTDYALAEQALNRLGIASLASQTINTLSGGQLQLATIAKALVQEPKLIVLDEPTSALDFGRQQEVLTLILKLAADGIAVMMTTHDPNHAFILNQTVGLFDHSGHLTTGSPADLLTEANLRRTYHTALKLLYVPELQRNVCELQMRGASVK